MKQAYQSNAVTNIHIRNEINGSNVKNSELAEKFNISESNVSKWKNRESFDYKTSKPHTIILLFGRLRRSYKYPVNLEKTKWLIDEVNFNIEYAKECLNTEEFGIERIE